MGCAYQPYGPNTRMKNNPLGILEPGEQTDNVSLCPGSGIDGEALAVFGRTSVAWNLVFPKGYPKSTSLDARFLIPDIDPCRPCKHRNVSAGVLLLPSTGEINIVEYLSATCTFSETNDYSFSDCNILFNRVPISGFERSNSSASTNKVTAVSIATLDNVCSSEFGDNAVNNLRNCLCSGTCVFQSVRFGQDLNTTVYLLRYGFQSFPYYSYCILSSASGPRNNESINDLTKSCFVGHENGYTWATAFDPVKSAISEYWTSTDGKANLMISKFDESTKEWHMNSNQNKSLPTELASECDQVRLGIIEENYFYFCLTRKMQPQLHIIDNSGKATTKTLNIDVREYVSSAFGDVSTVVRSNSEEAQFILFYPHPDFADGDSNDDVSSSCYYFVFKTIHATPQIQKIPYCVGNPYTVKYSFEGRLVPYYLPQSEIYLFGPVVVDKTGRLLNITSNERYHDVACLEWQCAPLLPVESGRTDNNGLILAAMQNAESQRNLWVADEVRYFNFKVNIANSKTLDVKLPCYSSPMATLNSFGANATLFGNSEPGFSGFLEEYYLLNRNDTNPKLKYQPVSYWGPAPEITSEMTRLSVGRYTLVNLFPSVKTVYRERRLLSLTSIPANVYNAFAIISAVFCCVIPSVYFMWQRCTRSRNQIENGPSRRPKAPSDTTSEATDNREIDKYNGREFVNKWGFGKEYWFTADRLSPLDGRMYTIGGKIDLFKEKPLCRPPTKTGVFATVRKPMITYSSSD